MSHVYVVTKGEYSDYRIVRIFSDKEAAVECARAVGCYAADVEEWELGEGKYIPNWVGKMYKNSDAKDVENDEEPSWDNCFVHVNKNNEFFYHFSIQAETQKKAVKIANERRAQYIATGLWDFAKSLPPKYEKWYFTADKISDIIKMAQERCI